MVFYLKTLRKHLNFIVSKNSISEYYVLKYPAFTAIVVVTNVFQFFFSNPPFLFYAGMWLITLGFLVYLLKFSIDVIWQRWVLMLSILYFIVYFDNMILLPHFADKIFVLILSVLSIALGIAGLFNLKKSNDKVMFLKWFLWIFIFFESLSLLSNLFDDFNASKRAMIAGVMEMVMIVLMVWTLKVLYKVFYLSLEVYKKSDDNNFTINLERFNKNMPKYYFALAIVGWIYMFVNFFYVIHIIIQPIIAFFTEERQIGNFVFTFDHIILFVTIILISTVISKILSYLLADSFVIKESAKNKKSINLGSWVLLLRIAIISIGLMIAFVSAGIPFDRITIIISALSVGIGFGMQTLVNNLVSGLILAFEKPINVGDVVELAGQTGRMKSIGFRSSMITTWDGSDVIIPNGDLLNQHLINWTLGNSQARFNIVVGIAYGTDLEQVHQLAIDLLNNQKDVLKYPQPLVVFKEFAGSSIDMDIKFWVADYSTGVIIRSQLIVAIDKLFKENNIVIPFPQQDVYIKSIAKENEEK
jgi:small-conductance mechanosensitive channel